jgi:YrbI family 3-deoxy-D-manno-octulosonate 8-phosphate phosphatase
MIKIVLLDIDGVLTNGKVTVDAAGNETKTIDFKDLDAVFEMKRQGLKVGLITGEDTPITLFFRDRFKPHFFYNGCKGKTVALDDILSKTGVSPDQVCYVGDGRHDISIMKRVGFAACPANAISPVKEQAAIHLERKGGDGCVWELLEWISKQEKNES